MTPTPDSPRVLRRYVLTPEAAGEALAAAGWVAVDCYRWSDGAGLVLGWPMALDVAAADARRNGGAA